MVAHQKRGVISQDTGWITRRGCITGGAYHKMEGESQENGAFASLEGGALQEGRAHMIKVGMYIKRGYYHSNYYTQ